MTSKITSQSAITIRTLTSRTHTTKIHSQQAIMARGLLARLACPSVRTHLHMPRYVHSHSHAQTGVGVEKGRTAAPGVVASLTRWFHQGGRLEEAKEKAVSARDKGELAPVKIWGYEEICDISEDLPPNTYLIDTRETSELKSGGTIPSSLNVPITSNPNAFQLPKEAFAHMFGFEKPDPASATIITYCRAGVRAKAAAQLVQDAGYVKVGMYPGSWLNWTARQGRTEKYEPRGAIWDRADK